jgi:hypothetical protein
MFGIFDEHILCQFEKLFNRTIELVNLIKVLNSKNDVYYAKLECYQKISSLYLKFLHTKLH